MNKHIHSLTDTVLASTTESVEHSLMLPIIDVLDEVSSSPTVDPVLRWKCILTLFKACGTRGMLPTRYPSIKHLVVSGNLPNDCGGFADIWHGEVDSRSVAVKVARRYSTVTVTQAQERFYREVLIWGRLSHPNVLPFLGVDLGTFPLAAVSTWMQHGNMKVFLVRFPTAPRLKLILDVSRGLEYIHELGVIHGDLKSLNVLIDDNHSARLADFGSSSILPPPGFDATALSFSTPMEGTVISVRWSAPELIYPEQFGLCARVRSKESDIYALAMVMYEAFSGLLPFAGYRDEGVMLQVMSDARPDRPLGGLDLGLADGVWAMMQECWDSGDRRWTISRIVSYLEPLIAPTMERVGESDERTKPEPEVARPKGRKNLLRRVSELFRTSPTKRAPVLMG